MLRIPQTTLSCVYFSFQEEIPFYFWLVAFSSRVDQEGVSVEVEVLPGGEKVGLLICFLLMASWGLGVYLWITTAVYNLLRALLGTYC